MDIKPHSPGRPLYADINETFDEFLIASGVGKMTFKISDVCTITTDYLGRTLRYMELDEDIEEFEEEFIDE